MDNLQNSLAQCLDERMWYGFIDDSDHRSQFYYFFALAMVLSLVLLVALLVIHFLAAASKINHSQTDIAINWMGGLHHAKKSEVYIYILLI